MSSQPECRNCGDYVMHGSCLCSDCDGAASKRITELERKLAEANARVKEL